MAKPDYYETLGINRDSTRDDIKKSYRRLAMKFHPDRNPNDKQAEEKFKDIKEAYEILINDEKRNLYDTYGHSGINNENNSGMGGFTDAFGDIFGEIFGNSSESDIQKNSQSHRGSDLKYKLNITLEQSANGFITKIKIPNWENCFTCKGSCIKPGTKKINCSMCNGYGNVRMRQGIFSVQQTCPKCSGSGKEIKFPCSHCEGQGRIKKNKILEVSVPKGIDDGMRIRSPGNGEPGLRGGENGDLYIEIKIKKHNIFKRDKNDIHCEIIIPFTKAALGGSLQVPTLLKHQYEIFIPEGTQSGKIFRLRGKGIKGIKSNYFGDLYCKILIEIPIRMTEKQKKILKDFDKCLDKNRKIHLPKSRI